MAKEKITYTQEQIDYLKSKGWIWRASKKYHDSGIWIKSENRQCSRHGLTPHAVVLIETGKQKIARNMQDKAIKDEDIDSVCKLCCDSKKIFYHQKEKNINDIDF